MCLILIHSLRVFPFLILISTGLNAQRLTQVVRGEVRDQASGQPLTGVMVVLPGTDPLLGTSTDESGVFRIADVPVGRQTVVFRYIGYREAVLNPLVSSGKETVLDVKMEEDISQLAAVEIVEERDKREALNQMSTVSARTFNVEETQKFAAAVNDPGRMAVSFAGVVSADDGSNRIAVRGNSPNGLLWRMEGIDIPNPNHYASAAAGGGGVSILSAQTLADSDFLTGAFAAEYGNALGGVFDLRLRRGNNEKREYTVQAGVLGLESAAEGPAGSLGGSYLVNYRYSTLSLLGRIGVPLGDAVTNFQDISYNVVLPTRRFGTVQFFGFGGLSTQRHEAERDSSEWSTAWQRIDDRFHSHTGAFGAKHTIRTSDHGFLTTSAMLSGNTYGYRADWLDDDLQARREYEENYITSKGTLSTVYQHKLNARHTLRAGTYFNVHGFSLKLETHDEVTNAMQEDLSASGRAYTIQPFVQMRSRLHEKLVLNAGLHAMVLTLNGTYSLEPRAGIRYQAGARDAITAGYGLHSQMQPVGTYKACVRCAEEAQYPNRDLGFNKAHHIVAGYEHMLTEDMYVKAETYYQHLHQIAVSSNPAMPHSSINQLENYMTEPLVNSGKGRNYGVELTLEQFTARRAYFLLAASLYESQYMALDGIWRNTRFNGNHAVTFTGGKEWPVGKGEHERTLGVNLRVIWTGGLRHTPVDLEASREEGWTVFEEDRAYELRNPDYMRADLRISLRTNRPGSTRTLALDIQNATNRKKPVRLVFRPEHGND
jgi:hypothetical protein